MTTLIIIIYVTSFVICLWGTIRGLKGSVAKQLGYAEYFLTGFAAALFPGLNILFSVWHITDFFNPELEINKKRKP